MVKLARRLKPPRDEAALSLLRSAKALVKGRSVLPSGSSSTRTVTKTPYGTVPGPNLPKVEPIAADAPWLEPPISEKTGLARTIYPMGGRKRVYDVKLLEELNEEYKDKPIVPAPRLWTSEGLGAAARRRLEWAHNHVDLRDQRVLEVGCGNGYELWSLAHNLGCDAYGVDVIQPNAWEDLVSDRVKLQCLDLTVENPFEENFFDRIISYTVWEHVVHPHKLLDETFKIMKPGGLQWIRANLWAGPQASHRYREIFFPWPHLLFSDDVIAEWDEKNGRPPKGSAWVNKLSWGHYERYIHDIGYRLRRLQFQEAEIDWDFYNRFEDVLGCLPISDLRRDFFLAVLEKPADA